MTEVPVATLLSCAPMAKIDAGNQTDTDITSISVEAEVERSSKFTAEVHAEHFKKVFLDTYGVTLGNWAKAAIAKNTTTNKKNCRILALPHVGCNNYKLNLDMESWVSVDVELKQTLESITSTMKSAKNSSLKNAAILSLLIDLKPVLYNKTRWSEKFNTFDRFIKIRTDLIAAAAGNESEMEVEDGLNFLCTCEKYHRIMKRMNDITIGMQKSCVSLLYCRRILDYIISKHETDTDNPEKVFYMSTFTPNRIKTDGPSPNSNFETGVTKIQDGRYHELDDDERAAVRTLLVEENNVEEEVFADESGNDDDSFDALLRCDPAQRMGGVAITTILQHTSIAISSSDHVLKWKACGLLLKTSC